MKKVLWLTTLLISVITLNAFAEINSNLTTQEASPDTSAPDAFGYTYVRSTDPGGPVYNWIDITTIGTQVNGLTDDNNVGPYPVGFDFPYYWYSFNSFRVGSNGYITPGNQTSNFASPFAELPATAGPNDIIAALVGDLVFSGQTNAGGQCFYWSNNVDTLIVSYINVTEWEQTINPSATHTFQIILSKVDSSITFQYGAQGGAFNTPNNTTLCIGIENQTGTIGLNYGFSAAAPHAFMPTNGLAVKIKRTVNTGLSITDAGMVGGFNFENIAKIIQLSQSDSIKAVVKNFGTITLSNVRITHQIVKSGQPTFRDTIFIASMAPSEEMLITFPKVFTPASTGTYTATFTATIAGDQGPTNNTKIAEIVSVDLTPGVDREIAFEAGTNSGNINWTGGGGMGVLFDVPSYPVNIISARVNIEAVTSPSLTVQILSDSMGQPGHPLATRNITAIVGWNTIDFASDSVIIENGSFFIGCVGQVAYRYETTSPISNRTWEYTGGWAPYRSRDVNDVHIRVTVRKRVVIDVDDNPITVNSYQLYPNFPNPFNPTTAIKYDLKENTKVTLKIFNTLGQEVRTLVNTKQNAGTYTLNWDGKNDAGLQVSSGLYIYRIEAGNFVKSHKMMLLK